MPRIGTDKLRDGGAARIQVLPIKPAAKAVRREVHRHDYYELLFFKSGGGTHMIDLVQHALKPPCVHLVAPGQVHALARSAGTEGVVVVFDKGLEFPGSTTDDVHRLFHRYDATGIIGLHETRLLECTTLADLIATGLERAEPERALVALLCALLAKCAHWSAAFASQGDVAGHDLVRRFLADVDREFSADHGASDYAGRYGVSVGHLTRLLKARIGRSVVQVILERRMLEAKRLLLHSTVAVKELGYDLGFNDPAYFTRVFKKVVGSSPMEFRERMREKYQP